MPAVQSAIDAGEFEMMRRLSPGGVRDAAYSAASMPGAV